jgi:transposase
MWSYEDSAIRVTLCFWGREPLKFRSRFHHEKHCLFTYRSRSRLDWADQQHVGCLYDVASGQQESFTLESSAEAIPLWLAQLRQRYGGRRVAIVLEQRRGALIHALLGCDFVMLYPINPQSLAKYRQAYFSSGAKSDTEDAPLLMEWVRHRPDRFHPWQPDDAETRSLQLLTEARRRWVDQQTALTNQLTQLLKGYYPQALELAGELSSPGACQFLKRWPTLAALQKARPSQIRQHYQKYGRLSAEELDRRLERIRQAQPLTEDPAVVLHGSLMLRALVDQLLPWFDTLREFEQQIAALFAQHPDRPLFDHLPGAGKVLSPRLLAAFGTQRDRWQQAGEVLTYWGIAPVTEQSGRSRWVHWRLACPKFQRQSWHELPPILASTVAGPGLFISNCGLAAKGTMPPCALWLTSGFASCFAAGKRVLLTTSKFI